MAVLRMQVSYTELSEIGNVRGKLSDSEGKSSKVVWLSFSMVLSVDTSIIY